MSITIDPQLEHEIERRARTLGYGRPGDYIAELVKNDVRVVADEAQPGKARQWIDRIRGTATSGLTTDEIMNMTRSDADLDGGVSAVSEP